LIHIDDARLIAASGVGWPPVIGLEAPGSLHRVAADNHPSPD
jgi:hypothetical protein